MNKKCYQCHLVNFAGADACARCNADLRNVVEAGEPKTHFSRWLLIRAAAILLTCSVITIGFYASLIASAKRLSLTEKEAVRRSVELLHVHEFETEVMMLRRFTVFRGSDNWLNAFVPKENAYAATNFPFGIITLYPDFFTYPVDDLERAAILLHEARHLLGDGEKAAYKFVWNNRQRLGWTEESYGLSSVWINVRQQTKEEVPELFVCAGNPFGDCTD